MVLKIKRGKPPYMFLCLLIAAWLCLGQVLGSRILILSCLAAFLLLTAVAAYKGFVTPILLFFLPWSSLLRVSPDTISFYTLALAVACVVCLVRRRFYINIFCVLLAIGVLVITLIGRAIENDGLSNSYIMFMFLLCGFSLVAEEVRADVDFKQLTLFFATGIVCAALSAQQLLQYPSIEKFVDVHTQNTVVRMSGYMGDANFYAAQVTAAISGTLLLLLRETDKTTRRILILLAVVLVYCGLLSASKSFFITMIIVAVLWVILYFSDKERRKLRTIIPTSVIALFLVLIVIRSSLFSPLWNQILIRFSWSDNVSEFTTGRTDLWQLYVSALLQDARYLLIGRGMNKVMLTDHNTHSTPIQLIYQLGLFGTVFLVQWEYYFVRQMYRGKRRKPNVLETGILLVGVFAFWLALDMLHFDDFFLMPMYAVAGLRYFGREVQPDDSRKPVALD